jgi:hypothetical protein
LKDWRLKEALPVNALRFSLCSLLRLDRFLKTLIEE